MSQTNTSVLNLPLLAGAAVLAACFLPFGVWGESPTLWGLPAHMAAALASAESGYLQALPWLVYAIPAIGAALLVLGALNVLTPARQIALAGVGLLLTMGIVWYVFHISAHNVLVPDAGTAQPAELRAGLTAHSALIRSEAYQAIAPWGWGRWGIFAAFAGLFFLAGARDNSTLGYMVRRIAGAIPTLFIIIVVTFLMMRLAPGGPFDGERPVSPEIRKNLEAAYDLDKPVHEQLFIYIGRVVEGDFGPSYKTSQFTVGQMIGNGAPVSALLGLFSVALAALIGTTLGVFAALRQNSASDYSVMSIAMIGITIPTFVTAPILQLAFGVYMGWLPVQGNTDRIAGWIMPVIVLALPQIAIISRLVRGSMIEVLRSNYVRTARAKGLSETAIVMNHVLRAGLLPLVSYLGPAIAGLMTGSLVVEQIFGLPGIGRFFVRGAFDRDYTLVMGVVILYSTLILIFNIVADVLYRVLDPKVRLG